MSAATILVVDDQQTVLNFVGHMLRGAGYNVLSATDPRQALEFVKSEHQIDLLLSDVEMPGMRGTELVGEFSRIAPDTATVLMTGSGMDLAETPPGTPLLRKPVSMRNLLSTVEAALARGAEANATLQRESEKSVELRRQSRALASEVNRTLREAAEGIRRSRVQLGVELGAETQLRSELEAAQTDCYDAITELEQFHARIEAGSSVTGLASVTARQRAAFEKYRRALDAFTDFVLSGRKRH